MADIEAQVASLTLQPTSTGGTTAVVGGMEDAPSAGAAMQWLKGEMTKASIDGVVDVYHKCGTDVFNGMVFVKFPSAEKLMAAIQIFNAAKVGMMGKTSFMNADLPLKERAAKKFLGDCKKMLIGWKYAPSSIRYDDTTMELSVGGSPILKAVVQDYKFKVEWLHASWAEWPEMTADAQFKIS